MQNLAGTLSILPKFANDQISQLPTGDGERVLLEVGWGDPRVVEFGCYFARVLTCRVPTIERNPIASDTVLNLRQSLGQFRHQTEVCGKTLFKLCHVTRSGSESDHIRRPAIR